MKAALSLIFLSLLAALWYLLLTPNGGLFLSRILIQRFVGPHTVTVSSAEGSVLRGLHLENLTVRQLPKGLPKELEGATLWMRRLSVKLPLKDLSGFTVTAHSARLQLSESEPVLASGTLDKGKLSINLYSRTLDVQEVLRLFLQPEDAERFTGTARQVDLTIHGPYRKPKVSGGLYLEELHYGTLVMKDCPVAAALEIVLQGKATKVHGEVLVKEGDLLLRDTAVKLEPSRFLYVGNPKLPRLDLHGMSEVEGIPIRSELRGTFRQPQLKVSSVPPLPQDHLLLMLATGRRWKGMEGTTGAGGQAGLSLDLVGQFLDYTVLGGSAGSLAQRLGIEASVIVGEEGTGSAGVRKAITDKVGVRYGVEQTKPDVWGGPTITRQKVGAEYQVTESDQISLEADSQLDTGSTQTGSGSVATEPESQRDSKVFLQYKRKF